jgi:hypothetical protein
MSKMGDWVLDIEFDKINLSRDEFVSKHGKMFAYIYDEQLGIIPNVQRTETRNYDNAEEVTRTPKDDRQKPVPYSRTPILRVRNAKGNGRSGPSVHRTSTRNVHSTDIQ